MNDGILYLHLKEEPLYLSTKQLALVPNPGNLPIKAGKWDVDNWLQYCGYDWVRWANSAAERYAAFVVTADFCRGFDDGAGPSGAYGVILAADRLGKPIYWVREAETLRGAPEFPDVKTYELWTIEGMQEATEERWGKPHVTTGTRRKLKDGVIWKFEGRKV